MEYTTEYYPWDKWEQKMREDMESLKNGKMPRIMHMPVKMMTIKEIIDQYGIDQKNNR